MHLYWCTYKWLILMWCTWQSEGYFWERMSPQSLDFKQQKCKIMLNLLNTSLKKKNWKSKIKHLQCDHSGYLEWCDICDIKKSTFLKKSKCNKNFLWKYIIQFGNECIGRNPYWWRLGSLIIFSITTEDKNITASSVVTYMKLICDILDKWNE